MKKVILLLTVIIGIMSCSKPDTEEINGILIGNFIEVAPIGERVTLEFSSESELTQRIKDFDIIPTYTIKLLNTNQLELSCNECDESQSTIVLYRIIDNNKFEIGGFYPADSTEIMTFERN
ncbi:MAG: hypothetical protein L3J20_05140 [Flavobacteriaceae bacterium]|nr:hypothetical protein [Flavobacteriaceae bacterium]